MSQLGSFERELLSELRAVVAERGALPEPRRPLPRGRVALATVGGAGVLAAGLLVGPAGVDGGDAPAAHAVVPNGDGTVTVTINRIEDAAGLERELAAHGVAADIEYLPPGVVCGGSVPRYEPDPMEDALRLSITHEPRGRYSLTLDPADLRGRTLVMEHTATQETTVEDGFEWNTSIIGITVGVAVGPVAACEQVEVPTER